MKQRYNRWMKSVRPSESYQMKLEAEMNRELQRQKDAVRRRSRMVGIACAAAAMILLTGILTLRGALPDRVSNPPMAEKGDGTNPPLPTVLPASSENPTAAPTSTASPSPSPTAKILETLNQGAWPSLTLETYEKMIDPSIRLADRRFEIHEQPDVDAPILGTLCPGDAYWPAESDQESEGTVSSMEQITWWDGTALQTGWRILPGDAKAAESLPFESIRLPGKLRRSANLLYGRDSNAPAVTTLRENALVYLYARYGDWLYVTTHGFDEETVWAGWLPVDSIQALEWRDPSLLTHVELLADHVNLRDAPDGKVLATLSRAEIDALRAEGAQALVYTGTTLPGQSGDWRQVSYGFFTPQKGATTGYLSAEYAKVADVTLGEELDLDDVVSAALCIHPSSVNPEALDFDQTLAGEACAQLVERLKGAHALSSMEKLCISGVAEIRLTRADGSVILLEISADDCPRLAFNGMIYDYRTSDERIEAFLNDGSLSASDILPRYFNELTPPIIRTP